MQYPDTDGTGGGDSNFLDDFLRGNRKDLFRSGDSSATQALDLMNSTFVMNTRVRAMVIGGNATLLQQNINLPDGTMVDNLFMAVLSRHPTTTELNVALANLANFKSAGTTRAQEATNLLWTLYNKVDFIFNY
jgi:hypothetical protein